MNCGVIRDLLPLYVDGIASEESCAAVEAHIDTCGECRALYEKMCAPVEVQATEEELDYMDAVKRQNRENRRFVLRVYGIALGIALLFGAMWLIDQMRSYQHWTADSVPISQERVEKEMPQTLLTAAEKALAREIFALPEVQPYLTDIALPPSALPEEVVLTLLEMAGKEPDGITAMYSYAAQSYVYLAYTQGGHRYVLEFLDADMSGHADELRKMTCESGDDIKVLYYAKINAAMIGAAGTDNEEENLRHEEFYTTYEKVTHKRLWLDFFERLW